MKIRISHRSIGGNSFGKREFESQLKEASDRGDISDVGEFMDISGHVMVEAFTEFDLKQLMLENPEWKIISV